MPATAAAASWLLPARRFGMNRLRWWLIRRAAIPPGLGASVARVAFTHHTGQGDWRRAARLLLCRNIKSVLLDRDALPILNVISPSRYNGIQ
jgi:hypothetical protein